MGASKPIHLVQLQNDWTAKAIQLQEGYVVARTAADRIATAASENRSLEAAATQAALAEQSAAKAFNDFLNTGSTAYKVAQDIASTLSGPRILSTLERHQLQTEQRNLETAWEAFNDFKQTSGLKPIHVPPVYADNRIHFVDGSSQWDQSITGKLFGAVDAVKAAGQDVLRAATLSQADQYTACVGVIDAFTGALMGKVLPAHSQWGTRSGEVWDQLTGKAFDSSPAASTCRLIYPANNVPEFLRKYGAVQHGHNETLGALAAIDIDAKVLAQFGLADVLATQVASGGLDAAQAQQWLNDATASDELALFTPAPASAMAPLQAGTLTAQQVIDVRQALGLPDAPDVSGPGTQYADSGIGGVVTDAGAGESGVGGIGYVPPVPTLSPIDTTDASSVYAVNGADSQSDAARSGISLDTTMANGGLLFRESTIAGASLTPFHMEVLNSSPSGVAVIELAASKNVPFEIREGSATFYSAEPQFGAPNGIVVLGADRFNGITHHPSSAQNVVANVVTVVSLSLHEAAHALDHLDGTPLLHPKDFANPSDYATARAQSEGNSLSTEGRFDAEIQGQQFTPPGSTTAVTITPDTYIAGTGRVGGTYLGDAVDGAFDRRLNAIYNDPTLSPEAKADLAAAEGTAHNLNQIASTSNTTYLDQGLVDYAAYWSGVPAGQITGVQIDDNGQSWAVSTRAGVTEVTVNYGQIDTTRPAGTGATQAVSRIETTIDDDGNRTVTVVDYGRDSQTTTTYSPTGAVVGQASTPVDITAQTPPVPTGGPVEAPAPAQPSGPVESYSSPAVPVPPPSLQTIRVNANTTFTLNEEGDIVSETVTGLGGYTNTRSNTGERSYTDGDGNTVTQQQYDQYQAEARAVDQAATEAAGYVGFVNAMAGLRNWDDMSDSQRLSALTGVISQANALSDGALASGVGINSSALQGAGAALGFLAAAERGDTAGMVINSVSFADAVSNRAVTTALGDAVGVNAAAVLPGLSMIMAAARGDAMGAGTAAMSTILAAMNAVPGAGQVLAAFVIVGSFLMGKDEPPQQHGNAQAQWGDQGELDYGLQHNEGGGGKTAEKYASALMQGLQEAVAKQPELAIIPERAPRVGWVLEPGQDNLDRVYLEWEDASGQRHTRWYTDEGQPQPNRHGEAAGVKDIASDFMQIALSQGAIAPAAEVAELRQNWIEAMAPVVALEAQIAELDKLAEPVRPFQRMEGQQGLIWYDSVNPLRLAELEGQMAPLQQQADELRAKAKAQFDAELSGIEGVGTGDRPQTEVELQFIKEVLADGSGTLHITRDGKGGEIRWLDANNTREFDDKEGHTHGGVRDPNVATEKTIEAGDEDLQSTTNKTITSTTVQTKTTVGVGDARVADGEDGQVVSGQDGTQQMATGPGGSAVVSQTVAAVAQANATEPAEPAEDRTTVTVGEGIEAPSDAVTQPADTVQETNTVAQGQNATQQAEGEAVQHDGAAGTVLEGQADASHEAVDAESGNVVSNEGVANAPAPSDTITVKSGDSRITSTTAAPAPRPASPAPVAFVPVQPATQEQERRQAVAAMVNSAQAANPLGGDAALAGLAAVGIAASGAHMGAQAQPIVAQQVAQAAQAELETQAAQAESSTGQAPAPATPAVNPGTQLTANPDGPAQPLQLTQVNLGSYQVANVSTQPAATAPAAPAEPVQPGIRAEVTVQWQGSAAAPIAPAPAPTSAPTVAAPIAPPAVLQSAVFADQPLGGAPAPAPAPAVVPAPVPDITSGAGGDTPTVPPPAVPATPLPIAPTAQLPFVWSDAPLLSLTVWGGAEDTGLLFTPDMLAPARPGEGEMTLTAVGHVIGGEVALVDGQIVFRPDPHFNGEASFSYTVRNSWGLTSTGTAQVQIQAVNDLPQLTGEVVNSDEDVVLLIAPALLLANDTDVEPGSLQLTSVSGAVHGTVALVNGLDGQPQIEFTPEPHYHGTASFEYEVTDADGGTSRATVVLNLAETNDAPVAQADAVTGTEDTSLVIALTQLTGNDTDVDGDTLTVTAVSAATGGMVQLEEGAVHFTPQPDYFGPASFVYTVQDGRGGQAQALATLQIAPVNDAPVVGGETVSGVEDTALVIAAQALLANDHDVDHAIDSANLTVTAVGNAQGGTVTLQPDGSIRFEPLADHTGAAGFDYTVSDGDGGHTVASVVVQLAAVNDAPRLLGETIAATEDTPLSIAAAALLANDTDVDGTGNDGRGDLHITAVGNAAHGSVSLTGDGRILFTPEADYAGTAGFDYTVTDAQGAASMVRATLQVAPVNDAPHLLGETVNADEDTVVRLTAAQLLGNDADVDGDTLSIATVGNATHGSVALQADGSIVFTPTLNHHGAAAFTYTVSDGAGGLSQATVNLNLAAVNDAPSLQADHLSTAENQPVTVSAASLLANDTDVDGPHSALQVTTAGNAQHGSVSLANGQVTFTPDADYFGPAAFDYTVTDAEGGQATATAHVNVQWVNRAPVAAADTLATQNEDTNVLILAGALLANDSDGDSARGAVDSLRIHSVAAIVGQTHGAVSLTAEGNVLFVPDADYAGPVNFSYVVADAAGVQSSATAGFALANVNDAPTVAGEVISAKNQAQVWIDPATLLANDVDRDSIHAPQDLRIVAVDGATNGSVALQSDGRILFTPSSPGMGGFTYTVQDASGATAQGTAQVNTGNAAPTVLGETTTLQEDQIRTFSPAELLANDTDPDNAHTDLHITAVGGASGGSVVLNAQGQMVFTPTLNHTGAAGFSYTVADGDGGTSQASVNLTYTPVNDAPTAVGEVLSFNEDQVATINTAALLANDSDVDGPGALSVSSISNVSGGSASLQGSQVVFTPWANFNGYAGFDYTVSDSAGGASQARADVYFNPVNDAPVVNNEFYAGHQDTTLYFSAASLLANDTDVETPGSLSIVNAWGTQGGSAYLSGGTVVFTPTAGHVGQASLQYQVVDPQGGVGYGTTTINLARANRSPVAVDDSFATQEDTPTRIAYSQLLGNDSDDAGSAGLRVTWVGNAQGGTVSAQGDGSALFTPSANYYGQARFQYQLADADNAATLATAYINVSPVNDAPVIITLTNAGTWGTVQAYDPDSDMSRLVYELASAPTHGYVAVQGHQRADGVQEATWTFASNAADPYYGPVSFAVRVRDPEGASATGTLWVNHTGGFGPVALDMDGDGVELVSASASSTFADVDADGVAEQLGWVTPDDAVLAWDADDNGQIDIANETSFVQYLPGAKTDLEGLAAFDTDGDGALSAADEQWQRFGALQDANASGQQDAGEFQSLDALGIQSISLTRQGTPTVVEGNTVFGTAEDITLSGIVIESFFPANAETAAAMVKLTAAA